jgi:hypothetical protein
MQVKIPSGLQSGRPTLYNRVGVVKRHVDPKIRDWYERETAEKAFTLTGCVL